MILVMTPWNTNRVLDVVRQGQVIKVGTQKCGTGCDQVLKIMRIEVGTDLRSGSTDQVVVDIVEWRISPLRNLKGWPFCTFTVWWLMR